LIFDHNKRITPEEALKHPYFADVAKIDNEKKESLSETSQEIVPEEDSYHSSDQ
jgi:hypothetical protein